MIISPYGGCTRNLIVLYVFVSFVDGPKSTGDTVSARGCCHGRFAPPTLCYMGNTINFIALKRFARIQIPYMYSGGTRRRDTHLSQL